MCFPILNVPTLKISTYNLNNNTKSQNVLISGMKYPSRLSKELWRMKFIIQLTELDTRKVIDPI